MTGPAWDDLMRHAQVIAEERSHATCPKRAFVQGKRDPSGMYSWGVYLFPRPIISRRVWPS